MPEKIANYATVAEHRGGSTLEMFWDSLKSFPGRGRITLANAVQACADKVEQHRRQMGNQTRKAVVLLDQETESGSNKRADSLKGLLSAVTDLQFLLSGGNTAAEPERETLIRRLALGRNLIE